MKTYIYYYTEDNKTFSVNYLAKDMNEACEIAIATGYELKGEKVEEFQYSIDGVIIDAPIDFKAIKLIVGKGKING